MSDLQGLLPLLASSGQPPVTFEQLVRFISFASRLRNEILLVQPGSFNFESHSRPVLPPSIQEFISESCYIPLPSINIIWKFLAQTAWNIDLNITPATAFRSIFPPSHQCMNTSCKRFQRLMLKKAESRQAVLFTMDYGAIPVWSVHLICECCNVNYHHNYQVYQGQQIYYDGIPEILQIGEHQFAERKLVNIWIMMMLLSWTSATNCARVYNLGFSGYNLKPSSWQFNLEVTSDEVYDAFTILSLLEDSQLQRATLVVPHGGLAKDRFTEAIRIRNNRFRLCSQPELFHYCNKCTRWYHGKKVSVIVIDGVANGHRCCGVPNCKIPLKSNHDCFCPTHYHMKGVCAIIGCTLPVASEPGRKTCSLPEHEAVEKVHNDRGQARFQLKERQRQAQIAHPRDALPVEVMDISELIEDADIEDNFEFNGKGQPILADSAPTGKKSLRAQFGRKRTHNEQLFVAPCGMIIARETFYHAEAIYSVIEMIKRTYRIPGTKPDHIFFDNNCTLGKAVKSDPFFRNIGLTVDVFHFKCKHSEKDKYCQENCNPIAYPELLGEGDKQWYFNSSVAEQTNSWMGGYQAICREMRVDRYNFFLDEMIRRRNIMTLAKLAKEQPGTWPIHT
ncbi:hypothetical protein BYT27DRAFT_7228010 [Phlegmacium glaucopus]|nr:hypothetical protein BYT27DRAFT_7228010 [Phlegmacium glaucopus]